MYNKDTIFTYTEDPKEIKAGRVLLSEPLNRDLFFGRAAILIVEHNAEGTIGFVLNKPLIFPQKGAMSGFPMMPGKVFLGGPVQLDTLHFIHNIGNEITDSVKISKNVYWSGNFEVMQILFDAGKINHSNVRFFIGYSGWTPKQLANEIKRKMWVITEMTDDEIFSSNENSWYKAVENLGNDFKPWLNVPDMPFLN